MENDWFDLAKHFPAIVTAILGTFAIILAAWLAGNLSRRIKISEFRQAWIREQRDDIARYIEAARRWYWKYEEVNDIASSSERECLEKSDLFPISNEVLVIIWRIRLRLNPKRMNEFEEDSRLYENIKDLIDPGKVGPDGRDGWERRADKALTEGQKILKREWDRAKGKSWWKA